MADDRPHSIDRLPTLTEVLEVGRELPAPFWSVPPPATVRADARWPGEPPVLDMVASLGFAPAVSLQAIPTDACIDESALVERVLAELEPRIAALLEARLREALAPALARAADSLIRETRVELAAATRALVEESLAQVLRQPHQG